MHFPSKRVVDNINKKEIIFIARTAAIRHHLPLGHTPGPREQVPGLPQREHHVCACKRVIYF